MGIIPENKICNRNIVIIDHILGFIEFLYLFYEKVNYFEDITIILKIKGIGNCIDDHAGTSFRQDRLSPIEIRHNVDSLVSDRNKIAKALFEPVFIGFGYLQLDIEIFYKRLESSLNSKT